MSKHLPHASCEPLHEGSVQMQGGVLQVAGLSGLVGKQRVGELLWLEDFHVFQAFAHAY